MTVVALTVAGPKNSVGMYSGNLTEHHSGQCDSSVGVCDPVPCHPLFYIDPDLAVELQGGIKGQALQTRVMWKC
jgi:hypothetical protein